MEGLSVAEADLTVYIHPSRANKIRHAVHRQLSALLFTYDETFDGVILAYELVSGNKRAKILPGLIPYFGAQLKAELLLFSPKPDMLLEGKVVKLGKESIHVIVLGFASAAIMVDDIREEFKYMIKHGVGIFSSKAHKKHTISTGSMIRFTVKSLDEELLHITGSLLSPNSGSIRWLSKHDLEEVSQLNSLKQVLKKELQEEGDESEKATRPGSRHYHDRSRKRSREHSD